MNPFGVLPIDVNAASASARATAGLIDGQLADLRRYVEQEIGPYWLGVSSTTFQIVMADYHIYARRLYHALTEIADGLQGNFENYVQMESAINQDLGHLASIDGTQPPANLKTVPKGPTKAPGDFTTL